jgi:hypothetical protein
MGGIGNALDDAGGNNPRVDYAGEQMDCASPLSILGHPRDFACN